MLSVPPQGGGGVQARNDTSYTRGNHQMKFGVDFSYITYGALFLMTGAYTLSRNGHVRADVLYRFWKPRTQASIRRATSFRSRSPTAWPPVNTSVPRHPRRSVVKV